MTRDRVVIGAVVRGAGATCHNLRPGEGKQAGMFPSWLPIVAPLAVLAGVGMHLGRRARRAAAVRRAAAAWAQTAGTVLCTTIRVQRVGESLSEMPLVIYSYEVDGHPYQSHRVRAGDETGQIKAVGDASSTLDRYPVGSNVTVYYDPDDPANAALER
jgi:hypothetical protein